MKKIDHSIRTYDQIRDIKLKYAFFIQTDYLYEVCQGSASNYKHSDYIDYINRDYRDWLLKNISSFNPFIVSSGIADSCYDKWFGANNSHKAIDSEYAHLDLRLDGEGNLALPFDRFFIERDDNHELFGFVENAFTDDNEFLASIEGMIVHYERDYNCLWIGCYHRNLTQELLKNSDFVPGYRFHFYDLNHTKINICDFETEHTFLSEFLKILNSLSALTVVKQNRRPKIKGRSKKEKKKNKTPKHYILVQNREERKQYLKRYKTQKGEHSHCWEVMGHYRRIKETWQGHDMQGQVMSDWTWVKPHWKGDLDKPVLKKCRLIGDDNELKHLA